MSTSTAEKATLHTMAVSLVLLFVVFFAEFEPARAQDSAPRPKSAAPGLTGAEEWLNCSDAISLESLRGKVVVLDFWTYCCINCMHVLPELKKLEQKYSNQLVVIGVHSGKFDAEHDAHNIRDAILRYDITHPVVNDARLTIWRRYNVSIWPTLCLIDPEGNFVAAQSGEGIVAALDRAIAQLVKQHRVKGTLNETPLRFDLERDRVTDTPLRFPGKVLSDVATDRLFIADSSHNRIVVCTLSGKIVHVVGTGGVGRTDGKFQDATFYRPQGMALDGTDLFIADTENHAIRHVDLKTRVVTTVAGTGLQGSSRFQPRMPAKKTPLNSPWDLCFQGGKLYIAMAGPHQIWVYEPKSETVHAFAGSGQEDIRDGNLRMAAFAQPSGLASEGDWLFVADSEGSSIRAVSMESGKGVRTLVGTAQLSDGRLFTFGDKDGANGQALLQHPLGLVCDRGLLYVADTYNNKIKVVDPQERTCRTFLGTGKPGKADAPAQFDEPAGLSVANGKLFIADTNNHVIRVADLETRKVRTLEIPELQAPSVKSEKTP